MFGLSTLCLQQRRLWSLADRARSIQPKFRPVWPGKEDHLKRWTCFFETFPVGQNRSIDFWTEISGNFGWMDRARYLRTMGKEFIFRFRRRSWRSCARLDKRHKYRGAGMREEPLRTSAWEDRRTGDEVCEGFGATTRSNTLNVNFGEQHGSVSTSCPATARYSCSYLMLNSQTKRLFNRKNWNREDWWTRTYSVVTNFTLLISGLLASIGHCTPEELKIICPLAGVD